MYGLEHIPLNHYFRTDLHSTPTWGNLGYWKDTKEYPAAAQALAMKTAAAAGLKARDQVVHVGNGCGDADRLWLEELGLSSINAINPSKAQCAWQRESLRSYIRAGRFTIMENTAAQGIEKLYRTDIDAVVYIDCAYHFRTRQNFFTKAQACLRPQGHLGGCDIVLTQKPGRQARFLLGLLFSMGSVPKANLVSAPVYEQQLNIAGFKDISIESIGQHVFPGFFQATRIYKRRYKDFIPAKLWRRYLWTGKIFHELYSRGYIDYIVVSGVK